ncbi:MAG: DUF4164 domain-containing protein [Microcystis panniformis]
MSNETVTYSLEAVLTRIESKIDKIDERLTKLEIGQAELKAELKGDIKVLDEKIEGLKVDLKGDTKVLDEKIEGLTVRVAYQEFTNRGILIALVVAVLGGAAKLFGFFPNP